MNKRISTMVVAGLLVVGGADWALASSAQVAAGRSALFNNGAPTVSGMVAANTAFTSAVQSAPGDREARLFAAITRVLTSALGNGPGSAGLTTLRDLAEGFGLTRNSLDSLQAGPPFDPPPDLNGQYNPPATIPSLTTVTDFLGGPLVTLLDAAVADLDVIINASTSGNPFTVTLTAAETGDLPIEIDLGDVLTLKALFSTLKAQALILHAWDMDNLDLRQLFILGNAGVLQVQRDLLDKYQHLLTLNTTTAETMAQAKAALLLAITTSQAAYDAISGESDDQTDDLFTFADQQEMDGAHEGLDALAEIKASMDENRPTIMGEEEWEWFDGNWNYHHLWLKRDSKGAIIGGNTDFDWAIDPTTSQISNNSFIIKATQAAPCAGTWQLSGTMTGGATLATISSTGWDCGGQMANETFTGGQGTITKDAGSTIDFNPLFGKNGQAPVDIRALLPHFRADNSPILGAVVADPTFGGLWPDMTQEELDSPEMETPMAAITIDGSPADWAGVPAMTTDTDFGQPPPAAVDIQSVSVARDADYLYWMVRTSQPPTGPAASFTLTVNKKATVAANNHYLYATVTRDSSGNVSALLYKFDTNGNQVVLSSTTADATMGSVVEGRIPLAQLNGRAVVELSGNLWQTATPYGFDSFSGDVAMLLPTATVAGEIQYHPHVIGTDAGQTIVKAYNEANPDTGAFLGSAVVDGVGAYAIPGLPIGSPIYLFALGDTDHNGIMTMVDYAGMAGPVTPQASGANQNILITQPTPLPTTLVVTLVPGWNLLSSTVDIDVPTTVGMDTTLKSIWKWAAGTWAICVPGGDQGQAYAQAKGFGLLTAIHPGEGFWINSSLATTASFTGTPVYGPIALTPGWNLLGLKSEYPITAASISAAQSGVTSIWKWANGTWSVLLPGEEVAGAYVAGKNYGVLTTLAPGEGFWVNKK